MQKILTIILFIIIPVFNCFSANMPVISITDFTVASDVTEYKYIGKGIAVLIAGELRNSGSVKVIDREDLQKIITEHKLTLSGITEESKNVKIGELLSASHILTGSIIDMGDSLIISARLTQVTSGEIVMQQEIMKSLESYENISEFFSKSILHEFDSEVDLEIGVETQKKNEQAVIALSKGINEIDQGHFEGARAELRTAVELDPENETIQFYYSKVAGNTSKFKSLSEAFYTFENPAYLGTLTEDKLFTNLSQIWPSIAWEVGVKYLNFDYNEAEGISLAEEGGRNKIGYAFPVANNFGFQFEIIFSHDLERFWAGDVPYPKQSTGLNKEAYSIITGAVLSMGYKISDMFSIGLGFSPYLNIGGEMKIIWDTPNFAGNIGFVYQNLDKTFLFDTRIGLSSESRPMITEGFIEILETEDGSYSDMPVEQVRRPIFNENTISLCLNDRKSFLVIKQTNNIGVDRNFYTGSIIPSFESYILENFSLRSSLEGSFSQWEGSWNAGYGFSAGLGWQHNKFNLDFNILYRMNASRILINHLDPDFIVMLNLSWNDIFIKRKISKN